MKEDFPLHLPVLKNEVVEYLGVSANKNFIDCTLGEGGHALAILKKNAPSGKVIGVEINPRLCQKAKERAKEEVKKGRLIIVNDSYVNLDKIISQLGVKKIDGILFDLGLSSWHLERSGMGFTFQKEEPLVMRYDEKGGLKAEEIINEWKKNEIAEILKNYGEEQFAKRIAEKIVEERKVKKIKTTKDLVRIIAQVVPRSYKKRKIHFATKTFQALRITVNNELENLRIGLKKAIEILEAGGRLVVISFHSLEDKIVKNFFKEKEKEKRGVILTKKPIKPKKEEIKINFRARSAKLRALIKI